MKYLNTRTHAVIETACVCSGDDWVALKEEKKTQPKTKSAPKKTKKDVSGTNE